MSEGLLSWFDGREEEQLAFLAELVEQQSYSRSRGGVEATGQSIIRMLAKTSMNLELVPGREVADHLVFRSPACDAGGRSILLFGHMDTVFPPDTLFRDFRRSQDKVFGPGVIDMKGGLVAAIYALRGLHAMGLLDSLPVTLVCNSDEEIGSPESTPLIQSLAAGALFSLGFECGGLNGEVVTGRKGKAGYLLVVNGKAGHAAFAGRNKASAILELAHKTIAIEQLNRPEVGRVVNVGVVGGGIGPNTVPARAYCEIDSRFLAVDDANELRQALEGIAAQNYIAGTSSELKPDSGRLPMEQTRANKELFRIVAQEAQALSLPCIDELRSGVSDGNTIAQAGIPVVDGLGPIGDCDHSENEYMITASLMQRTRLAARAIIAGWHHYAS